MIQNNVNYFNLYVIFEINAYRLVARHGLRQVALPALLGESHHYADFCFAYGMTTPPPAAFVSTIRLRQAGFHEVCDTQAMFTYWLKDFIQRGILPKA